MIRLVHSSLLARDAADRQRDLTMKVHATTHGLPRDTAPTEDAWCVQERDDRLIAVLADGLGASKEGGAAARRAVEMMADYYLARPQAWSPRRALTEFAAQINRVLHQESLLRHGSPELLCTLSVIALEGDHLYGLNIGDSPVFICRGGQLTQLSLAHASAQPGMEHVLTRAIGLEPTVEPYFFESAIAAGDVVLLCSDGISTVVPSAQLGELLARRAGARTFVNAARERTEENPDERDDASAIVLDIAQPGWSQGQARRPLEVIPLLRVGDVIDAHRLVRSLQVGDRVWLAETADGARHVLKFPPRDAADDETRRDGFVREMWNATRVHSPDFVRAFAATGDSPRYYGMDYVEAPTLREVLRTVPLPVEEALTLGLTLLRAAQFLLTRDLAHGDIKPENLLVIRGEEGGTRFQLLDLGSAAEVFSVTSRAGTPSYLAPERFQGGPLSERTELFAIGVTLYEALTRAYPYGEVERFQTPRFEATPRAPSRLNPAVPPWLSSILLRSLSADPKHRYQNFSEMAFDLAHPEKVEPYHRQDAPLMVRNPLLVYKVLCLALLIGNLVLLTLLLRR